MNAMAHHGDALNRDAQPTTETRAGNCAGLVLTWTRAGV